MTGDGIRKRGREAGCCCGGAVVTGSGPDSVRGSRGVDYGGFVMFARAITVTRSRTSEPQGRATTGMTSAGLVGKCRRPKRATQAGQWEQSATRAFHLPHVSLRTLTLRRHGSYGWACDSLREPDV